MEINGISKAQCGDMPGQAYQNVLGDTEYRVEIQTQVGQEIWLSDGDIGEMTVTKG